MSLEKVSVIGSGTMGNGIAHVFAQNNYKVQLIDISKEILDKALSVIEKNFQRQVKKELLTQENMNEAISNISLTTNIEDASDADLIVEAVNENIDFTAAPLRIKLVDSRISSSIEAAFLTGAPPFENVRSLWVRSFALIVALSASCNRL